MAENAFVYTSGNPSSSLSFHAPFVWGRIFRRRKNIAFEKEGRQRKAPRQEAAGADRQIGAHDLDARFHVVGTFASSQPHPREAGSMILRRAALSAAACTILEAEG